jgi:hypothetical protein
MGKTGNGGRYGGTKEPQLHANITADDAELLATLQYEMQKRLGIAPVSRTHVVQAGLRALAREYGLPGYAPEKG